MEQEETLCDEVESLGEFTYLGDSVSSSGGCDAVVSARTRFMLLKGMWQVATQNEVSFEADEVCLESYIKPAIPYGSEVWCLKENKMGIL